jgi:hypothetical protein
MSRRRKRGFQTPARRARSLNVPKFFRDRRIGFLDRAFGREDCSFEGWRLGPERLSKSKCQRTTGENVASGIAWRRCVGRGEMKFRLMQGAVPIP